MFCVIYDFQGFIPLVYFKVSNNNFALFLTQNFLIINLIEIYNFQNQSKT